MVIDDTKLLDELGDGVLVADEDGKLLRVNPRMAELLGHTRETLVGSNIADHLSDTEVLALVGLETAFGNQSVSHMQVVFRDAADAYVFTAVSGTRQTRADGQLSHYVFLCRQNAAVHDLLNESTRLAAQLSEKADLLEVQRAAAEERERETAALSHASKLESIGQLAAGIAHEINTPVQFIGDNMVFLQRGWTKLWPVVEAARALSAGEDGMDTAQLAKMIKKAKLPFLTKEVPRAIEQTLEGVERVAKIVRAMKDFSHPGGEHKQPTDLNKAIESTVTVARTEWKYVAELDLQLEPDLPAVPCHGDEFNQVILNMVVNAAHAIEESLGGEGGLGRITVRTRLDGDHVLVEVEDTGAGMPESVKEKIFDPFFTTKEVGKGTGQGLSLAYNVVKRRHGGRLEVNSVVGEGTRFTMAFPLVEASHGSLPGSVDAA